MAQPLTCSYQGAGGTLYVVIRRISDDYVWSTVTSTFGAWADGSIADYDVALTDRGGDLYSVAFPTAIAAGDYLVFFYEMAGASPAITDLPLKVETWHWDGAELSSASSVTLSAYALDDLNSTKRHMRITSSADDTLLTQLLNSVSAEIERVCGTQFKARDYREWYTGKGQRRLVLKHRPVQHVTRVAYGAANALTVRYAGSGIRANATVYRDPESPDAGGVRLVTVSTAGVATANNLTFADYPSVSLMATAISAVSGWTGTAVQNWPTADLHTTASEDALNRTVTFTYPDLDENTYEIDYRLGLLEFAKYGRGVWEGEGFDGTGRRFCDGFRNLMVQYRGGYETIPADVALVCREMVKESYQSGELNTGVKSFSLGPYSVTLSDDQAGRVRAKLAHYIDGAGLIGGSL